MLLCSKLNYFAFIQSVCRTNNRDRSQKCVFSIIFPYFDWWDIILATSLLHINETPSYAYYAYQAIHLKFYNLNIYTITFYSNGLNTCPNTMSPSTNQAYNRQKTRNVEAMIIFKVKGDLSERTPTNNDDGSYKITRIVRSLIAPWIAPSSGTWKQICVLAPFAFCGGI